MKLIVGLGNPGKHYEDTPHNVGFKIIQEYANSKNINFNNEKFKGCFIKSKIFNEDVILLKPMKFMNLSGEVVSDFAKYFKIDPIDILVIQDDIDLEFGKIRLKKNSSPGGHNGIKNIHAHLGSDNYTRLKYGVSNNKALELKLYVLKNISKSEKTILSNSYNLCGEIIDDFIMNDYNFIANKYN